MNRGATSNSIFTFPPGVNLEAIAAIELIVSGCSSGVSITKTGGDFTYLDGNKIGVFFSQEDTLRFQDNEDISMQWHWRNSDDSAMTSKIISTDIYEFLGSEPI